MPLIHVVVVLIVVGVILWLVNNYILMAGSIKSTLQCCRSHCRGFVAPEVFLASLANSPVFEFLGSKCLVVSARGSHALLNRGA